MLAMEARRLHEGLTGAYPALHKSVGSDNVTGGGMLSSI